MTNIARQSTGGRFPSRGKKEAPGSNPWGFFRWIQNFISPSMGEGNEIFPAFTFSTEVRHG